MNKLLVILGPTATGKTDLALQLAGKFQGELVACDSRQVYKGLDIGTGKEPREKGKVVKGKGFWEIDRAKIRMYDVADPKVQYTVADYVKEAAKAVEDISSRAKLPIIVGGTGFYLKALLLGLSNLSVPVDLKLRKQLEKLSVGELQEKLRAHSPGQLESLNESDRQNPRRLIRRLELLPHQPTNPYMETPQTQTGLSKDFDILKIGLTAPRAVLYKNIDSRVLTWIDQGIIEEARKLQAGGLSLQRMTELGLEYGVLADYLAGKIKSEQELIQFLQFKIHGYLRRQQTWFKKEKDVSWNDISDSGFSKRVEKLVNEWYA